MGQVLGARTPLRRRARLPDRPRRQGPAPRRRRAGCAGHGDRMQHRRGAGHHATTWRRCCSALLYAATCGRGSARPCSRRRPRSRRAAARRDPGRRDLTRLPTFTIDPDTARDFDDAISVAREGDGYRAHVHIADVSYFVDPDGEHRARGPAAHGQRLPAAVRRAHAAARRSSSDLCSLVAAASRASASPSSSRSTRGRRTRSRSTARLISSDHRLTYGFVDDGASARRAAGGRALGRRAGAPPAAEGCGARPHDERLHADARRCATEPAAGRRAGRRAAPPPLRARRAHDRLVRARVRVRPRAARSSAPRRARRRPRTRWWRSSCWPPTRRWPSSCCAARRAPCTACTSRPTRRAPRRCWTSWRSSACRRRRSRRASRCRRPQSQARLRPLSASRWPRRAPARAAVASPSRSCCCARSSRRATTPPTWATSASPARPTCTSPRPSAATPTWSRTGPAVAPRAGRRRARRRRAGRGRRATAPRASGRSRALELKADDVALCFLLDEPAADEGWEQVFTGEIIGLVGGGLFVRFGGVVRGLPAGAPPGRRALRARAARDGAGGRGARARGTGWATRATSGSSASTSLSRQGRPRAGRAGAGSAGDGAGRSRRGAGRVRPAPRRRKARRRSTGPGRRRRPRPRGAVASSMVPWHEPTTAS